MNNTVRIILSVIIGFIIGSIANMSLISVSAFIIPPPDGADIKTMEGIKASIQLFEPKHYIFPFLAHALGTLIGAIAAIKITKTNESLCAYIIGVLFLIGGTINVLILGTPFWFNALDLGLAYLPMTAIALKINSFKEKK